MKQIIQPLPGTNLIHQVVYRPEPTIIVAIEPEMAEVFKYGHETRTLRAERAKRHIPYAIKKMTEWINVHSEIAILPEWGEQVWEHASYLGGITELEGHGEVIAAWKINEEYDWIGLVSKLIKEKKVSF